MKAVIRLNGVINILKPPGMTSHDVVSFLRRQFKIKKIGHAGTLDPQAAGVLPLCLGQATRLIEFLTDHDKEYLCEMTLGITTTTQDAWGEVVERKDCRQITSEMIKQVLPQFNGKITQLVPAYSAVKVQGVPLYKKARLGMKIEPIARQVLIYKLEIIKFEPPKLTFLVHCSKGTYVRTICHDLGQALGVGGHLSFLLRTRVGKFVLADSLTLEEIAFLQEKSLLPLEYCVQGLAQIVLSDSELIKIKQGQKVTITELTELITPGTDLAVLNDQGKLQAVATVLLVEQKKQLQPKKVFNRE
jgi:tRNA pseudouridine55 synthase